MARTPPPQRQDSPAFIDLDHAGITVGQVLIPGVGLRVGLQAAGDLVHMSPAGARRMARNWESEEARAVELDWVATALREAADMLEAKTATKQ